MIGGRPKSVRVTLTVWYSVALVAVLGGYAAVVFTVLERSLWQQLDQALHGEDVEHIDSFVAAAGPGSPGAADPLAAEDDWAAVFTTDGHLLYQSRRAARTPLPGLAPPLSAGRVSVMMPNRRFLRVRDDVQTVAGRRLIVRVAQSEDRVRGEVALLLWIMGLGLPIAVAIAAFGGSHLARRALSPVDAMAERAQAISADPPERALADSQPERRNRTPRARHQRPARAPRALVFADAAVHRRRLARAPHASDGDSHRGGSCAAQRERRSGTPRNGRQHARRSHAPHAAHRRDADAVRARTPGAFQSTGAMAACTISSPRWRRS